MTCRYSDADWRDVLYNSVRATPGGVAAAATFLTSRRGKSMHPETLRAKLRGLDGDLIGMEIAELLTEWMQEARQPEALEWLHCFNARFGLAVALQHTGTEALHADALQELVQRLLQNSVSGGRLSELGLRSVADGRVDPHEADALQAQVLAEVRELLALGAAARAAAATAKGSKGGAA